MQYKILKESALRTLAEEDELTDVFSIRRKTPEESMEENPGHDVCPKCGAVDDWEYDGYGKRYCAQCEYEDPDYNKSFLSDEEQMEQDLNELQNEEGEERECGRCGKPFKFNRFDSGSPSFEHPTLGALCPECAMEQQAQDYGQE